MKRIPLGVVARPFGIKGELKLKPYNPRTTWFDRAEGVWLSPGPDQEPAYFKIHRTRRHKQFILLELEGISDRNRAEALRGFEAVVAEDELEPLEEGEFYWWQLIGLAVEDGEGRPLGEVIRLEETAPELGGNDNLVVWGEEGELMIPAVEPVVKQVDLAAGKIIVDPAARLLK